MKRLALLAPAWLLAGCTNAPMTTMAPKSDFAQWIHTLYWQVIGWDTLILLIVLVAWLLALFVFSTRYHGEREAPPEKHEHMALEVVWTVGPALVILAIAIPTVRTTFRAQPPEPPGNALEVDVTAHQWWWEIEYPDQEIRTANEIHIPVGQPVTFQLKSADVIHSFWVPALGGKRDVVPGHTNSLDLTPTVPGVYLGQCAEFCGLSHANMRLRVFVDTPQGFKAWVADQTGPAAVPGLPPEALTPVQAGARLYASSPCVTCHSINGSSTQRIGPDLTHFASRTTLAGATLANNAADVAAWIHDPEALKPGAQMPKLGMAPEQISDLVAYLESLK